MSIPKSIPYVYPVDGPSGRTWRSGSVPCREQVLSQFEAGQSFKLPTKTGKTKLEGFVHAGRTYLHVDTDDVQGRSDFEIRIIPWGQEWDAGLIPVPGISPLYARTSGMGAEEGFGAKDDGNPHRERAKAVAEAIADGMVVMDGKLHVSCFEIVLGLSRSKKYQLGDARLVDVHGMWRHPFVFRKREDETVVPPYLGMRTLLENSALQERWLGAEPSARIPDCFGWMDPKLPEDDVSCYAVTKRLLDHGAYIQKYHGRPAGAAARTAFSEIRSLVRIYEDWSSEPPSPTSVEAAVRNFGDALLQDDSEFGDAARSGMNGIRAVIQPFDLWWETCGREMQAPAEAPEDDAAFSGLTM